MGFRTAVTRTRKSSAGFLDIHSPQSSVSHSLVCFDRWTAGGSVSKTPTAGTDDAGGGLDAGSSLSVSMRLFDLQYPSASKIDEDRPQLTADKGDAS